MALPIDKLGTRYDPDATVIDPDRAKAYAAATNDDNPAYESGSTRHRCSVWCRHGVS